MWHDVGTNDYPAKIQIRSLYYQRNPKLGHDDEWNLLSNKFEDTHVFLSLLGEDAKTSRCCLTYYVSIHSACSPLDYRHAFRCLINQLIAARLYTSVGHIYVSRKSLESKILFTHQISWGEMIFVKKQC